MTPPGDDATFDDALLRTIQAQFTLDWNGIHGLPHWTRVRENGLRLAEVTGANPKVVTLFAVLHDSRRMHDNHDPEHGPRGALYAESLARSAFQLEAAELDLLVTACRHHSDGLTTGNITVLTCWDADRLDLGRVGIRPRAELLCTAAAREPAVLQWAWQRSIR